jgi:hypothetical protein
MGDAAESRAERGYLLKQLGKHGEVSALGKLEAGSGKIEFLSPRHQTPGA